MFNGNASLEMNKDAQTAQEIIIQYTTIPLRRNATHGTPKITAEYSEPVSQMLWVDTGSQPLRTAFPVFTQTLKPRMPRGPLCFVASLLLYFLASLLLYFLASLLLYLVR